MTVNSGARCPPSLILWLAVAQSRWKPPASVCVSWQMSTTPWPARSSRPRWITPFGSVYHWPTGCARGPRNGSDRFNARMHEFYPYDGFVPPRDYIFARTVPCPDTGHPTPLVPDWHLLRSGGAPPVVAEPYDARSAHRPMAHPHPRAGQGRRPAAPAAGAHLRAGKGISLFTGQVIPADYIKARPAQGQLGSVLYAVATKATTRLDFRPPEPADLAALAARREELARVRPRWEREGIIPTEAYTRDKTATAARRLYTTLGLPLLAAPAAGAGRAGRGAARPAPRDRARRGQRAGRGRGASVGIGCWTSSLIGMLS
jgi:hypothetical protein